MHRQPSGLEAPFIATGSVIVAGDAALTVLEGTQSMHVICQNICQRICKSGVRLTVCTGSGHSLASCLPADLGAQLHALLSQGQVHCQWDWVSPAVQGPAAARPVCLHVSASRLAGASHQGQAVYHLVFSDMSAAATLMYEAELEKKKYAIIAEITEDIPFEYDFATDTMVFAEKYCSLFGGSARIAHFCQRITDGKKVNSIHALLCQQLTVQPVSGESVLECHVRTKDGSYRWFLLLCKCVMDAQPSPVMAVGAIRNIDRQKLEQLRLLEKSRTDAMTGLRNKENTEEEIRKALALVGPGSLGALLMVDIDNFKSVNDTKGHLAGDAVLVQLGRQLSRTFRSEDIVGRVGGDEFHVFMRNIAQVEDIHEKVQELCSKVRKLFARNELGTRISISVGITWVEHPISYSELFRQADVALYRAKVRGKNCYDFFGKSCSSEQREHRPVQSAAQLAVARPQPGGRTVRNTLVLDIIDTLCSSLFSHLSDIGNMDQRIDRALHFIGNALDVSAIVIYEKSFDGQQVSITHEWVASENWNRKARCQNIPVESMHLPRGIQCGSVYYCSDVGALPPHERGISGECGVTSLLQCDIVCDNLVIGQIRFEERRSARIWEQQEIEALSLMSKLISGHISQKQSAGLLQHSTQAMRDILDSLPATFVFVISKDSYRLLYFNARVLEMFPLASVGMTCHEIFKNRKEPCSTCARSHITGDAAYVSLLCDSPFAKIARLSMSNIFWENRESGYVALISEYEPTQEEKKQQRLHEQYTLALHKIYDELFECNVTQNSYRTVYHVPNKYMTPPESGVLSEGVLDIALHMVHPDDSQRFLDFFALDALRDSFAAGKEYIEAEFRKKLVSGGYHWASLAVFPLRAVDGNDEMFIVFVMDINQRKEAEEIARHNIFLERQRLADERYKIIVEQTNTLVFEWDSEGGMHYISSELMQRFAGAYNGRDIMQVWQEDAVIHPDDLSAFDSFMNDSCTQQHPEMTVRLRKRDNTFIWCKVVLSCRNDAQGRLARYIGTLNDVDDATCSAIALRYRAEYDMLTGVFNMQAFYTRAEQLLRENPGRSYSIIRMDIDRFKVINDLYGLEAGDSLLKTMARLISERMNAYSVCGRISGDVFCMCVDSAEEEILDFVAAMTAQLADYPLTSRLVPSFGICRVDSRDTPINVLCDWAHLALKTVKGNVLVSHAFYDDTLRKRILEEKKIETEMHSALEDGQFQLYLQPKVQIATEKIVGFEGLVRWQHPTEGLIQPDRFIPLFEKNGFILRLDEYIWEQSCILLRTWLDKGKNVMPVSVNVSRMHIHDTRLCEKLLDLVARYNLPPHMLELELTESVFLDNEKNLVDTMETLNKHGFLFSLDDFGAGYSSLNMLKSLPIDTIKIDRGFLTEVAATERGKTIIRHTISLANALRMKVIAEGVENEAQAVFLQDAGCTVAQGFYYSPPVPIAVFEKMAFEHMCLLPHGHFAKKC